MKHENKMRLEKKNYFILYVGIFPKNVSNGVPKSPSTKLLAKCTDDGHLKQVILPIFIHIILGYILYTGILKRLIVHPRNISRQYSLNICVHLFHTDTVCKLK